MFKPGKKIYFVPSLHEKAIVCTCLSVSETDNNLKNRLWIIAQDKTGKVYEGYESRFSDTKPASYNGHAIVNKFSSVYYDNSQNKPVTLESLRENYKRFNGYNLDSFESFIQSITENGMLVPYSVYLYENNNI